MASAPRLSELHVAGRPAAWERLGFASDQGAIRVGATTLRIGADGEGICAWTLDGTGEGDIDGLATRWVGAPAPVPASAPAEHPNGALLIDHVVVVTPSLERTLSALAAVGFDLRRTRDAGTPERPVRQAFFRMGEVILEVVGPPGDADSGPARFWGLVVVVSDLDACVQLLGADLGTPRDAVQPGRRIATVRGTSGLGVPLALMTPDPRNRVRDGDERGRAPAGP